MVLGLVPLVCPRIQNGIRDDDLSIAGRPFTVTVGIRDNLPKSIAIQGREFLVKALHLIFPLAVCDKRLRADNHDVFQIGAGLQLLDNQTGLDGFTDTNTVCNQNPWLICFYQFQCRSELIGHEIDPGSIKGIQISGRRIVNLVGRKVASQGLRIHPLIFRCAAHQRNLTLIIGLQRTFDEHLVLLGVAKLRNRKHHTLGVRAPDDVNEASFCDIVLLHNLRFHDDSCLLGHGNGWAERWLRRCFILKCFGPLHPCFELFQIRNQSTPVHLGEKPDEAFNVRYDGILAGKLRADMRPVVPDTNHIADALPLTGRKIGIATHRVPRLVGNTKKRCKV